MRKTALLFVGSLLSSVFGSDNVPITNPASDEQTTVNHVLTAFVSKKDSPLQYTYVYDNGRIFRFLISYPYTNVVEYWEKDLSDERASPTEKFWHVMPDYSKNATLHKLYSSCVFSKSLDDISFPAFFYAPETLVCEPKTFHVDPTLGGVFPMLSNEELQSFTQVWNFDFLTSPKVIPESTIQAVQQFVNVNQENRIVLSVADIHGHYGIYKSLSGLVAFLHQLTPNISVVISGDLAHRIYIDAQSGTEIKAPECTQFNAPELFQFLKNIHDITKGHLYISLGNHDIQNRNQFLEFLKKMQEFNIPVLSNVKEGFTYPFYDYIQDYVIDGNTVYFPFCINFPNSGWNWRLSEAVLQGKDTYYPTVFTPYYIGALSKLSGDYHSRDGCINSLESAPGRLNVAAQETADKFLKALKRVIKQNPKEGPIYFVILAHEHPQRLLMFFEQISYFLKLQEAWLRRLVFIVAGGHEHKPYIFQKPCFMKAETGNIVWIQSLMGGPGMFGTYFNLFALRPKPLSNSVISKEILQMNQKQLVSNQQSLSSPAAKPTEWNAVLKQAQSKHEILSSAMLAYHKY